MIEQLFLSQRNGIVCWLGAPGFCIALYSTFWDGKNLAGCWLIILLLVYNSVYGLKLSFSIQEAREVDYIPAHLHEVPAHKAEAEAARDPQREGVRLWPGGTPPQLRPWWWVPFSCSFLGLNRGHSVRLMKALAGFQLWFVNAVCVARSHAQWPPATMPALPAWLGCHSNLRLKRV